MNIIIAWLCVNWKSSSVIIAISSQFTYVCAFSNEKSNKWKTFLIRSHWFSHGWEKAFIDAYGIQGVKKNERKIFIKLKKEAPLTPISPTTQDKWTQSTLNLAWSKTSMKIISQLIGRENSAIFVTTCGHAQWKRFKWKFCLLGRKWGKEEIQKAVVWVGDALGYTEAHSHL